MPEEEYEEEFEEPSDDEGQEGIDDDGEELSDDGESALPDVPPGGDGDDEEEAESLDIEYELDGKTIRETISKDDLVAYLVSRNGEPSNGQAQNESRQQVPQDGLLGVMYNFRSQGYSDEEIFKSIGEYYVKQQSAPKEEPMPEFETIEEQVKWMVDKQVQARVTPLERQLQEERQMRAEFEVTSHNEDLFLNELTSRGYDANQISQEEYNILRQTVNDVYGNINLKQYRLSPAQTQVIVDEFVGRVVRHYTPQAGRTQASNAKLRFGKAATPTTEKRNRIPQDVERMKSAPKVMAGRTVKTSGNEGRRGVQEGVSAQTRAERLRSI